MGLNRSAVRVVRDLVPVTDADGQVAAEEAELAAQMASRKDYLSMYHGRRAVLYPR
jgi:hypothetical protein